MAKQLINIGTSPNKGDGDPLRTAFRKINDNFNELYDANFSDPGAIESSITPGQDGVYDLGSITNRWADIHASDFLYLSGQRIEATSNGRILINGNPLGEVQDIRGSVFADDSTLLVDAVNGSIPYSVLSGAPTIPSDVADLTDTQGLLGGGASTGDVTFNGVKIIGAGTASGDGLGYSTLELVPDGTLVSDQYIVVDPTAPNHIHLRAGGTQDASTAALFLGGELNYVRTVDGYGVRLNNAQFIPDSVYFEQGVDYDSATWSTDESGNHWIDIRITDPFNPTRSSDPINTAGSRFSQYPTRNSIEVFTGSSLFTVSGNGQAYSLGNPYDYRIGTNEAPPANPTTLASLDYRLNTFNERYLYLENNTLEAYADTVSVFSGQTIDFVTGTGNIRIATDDNNNSYSWYFTAQGYLQFPQGLGPTTSKGKEGDEAGSVVVDADYIYYCHTDYTDGIADIWKRVQWSADTW